MPTADPPPELDHFTLHYEQQMPRVEPKLCDSFAAWRNCSLAYPPRELTEQIKVVFRVVLQTGIVSTCFSAVAGPGAAR